MRGPFRSLVAACSCPSQTMCSQITAEGVRKAIGRWDSLRAGESIGRSLAASRNRPPAKKMRKTRSRAGRDLIENQSCGENGSARRAVVIPSGARDLSDRLLGATNTVGPRNDKESAIGGRSLRPPTLARRGWGTPGPIRGAGQSAPWGTSPPRWGLRETPRRERTPDLRMMTKCTCRRVQGTASLAEFTSTLSSGARHK